MAQKISKTFSKIGENIKKIRQAKKLSQAEFAELFNLARPSVGAYEEGRSEPKIDTIIQIANHFRISIDVLLTKKLSISEIYSFDQLNRTLDKVHRNKGEKAQTVLKASIVRNTNQLEYIVNRDKNDYLSQLEQITIPVESKVSIRVFEVKGSEMTYNQQGIRHGDMMAAEKLDAKSLHEQMDQVVIIVTKEQILIKRLKAYKDKEAVLHSDDPNYPEITVTLAEILEVWRPIGVYSKTLSAPSNLEERLLKMEKLMERFKNKL